MGFDAFKFYLVDANTVDAQEGSLITQNWLGSLDYRSVLDGDGRGLDCNGSTRGVRLVEAGEASARKNLGAKKQIKNSELYSPKQISSALRELKINGLETQIFKALRKD